MDSARPRAREGLLASDHSKRGRRFVIVVDPATLGATLLEPWEHAIWVLCDGQRGLKEIVELLAPDVEGQAIDREVVWRCLKFFERQALIGRLGLRQSDAPPPGPVTVNELQRAYAEWHKEAGADPVGDPPPLPRTSPKIRAGLGPTVSSKRHAALTGVHSLLHAVDEGDADDVEPMPDLLAALDDAMAEASRVEASERERKSKERAEVQEVESRPPTSGVHAAVSRGVVVASELTQDAPDLLPPAVPSAPVTRVALPARPISGSGTEPGARAKGPAAAPPEVLAAAPPAHAPGAASTPPATLLLTPAPPAGVAPPAGSASPPAASSPPANAGRAAAQRPSKVPPGVPAKAAGGPTEPTLRLADLLATDATEPATITLRPEAPRAPRVVAPEVPTQLGSMVKKRPT